MMVFTKLCCDVKTCSEVSVSKVTGGPFFGQLFQFGKKTKSGVFSSCTGYLDISDQIKSVNLAWKNIQYSIWSKLLYFSAVLPNFSLVQPS